MGILSEVLGKLAEVLESVVKLIRVDMLVELLLTKYYILQEFQELPNVDQRVNHHLRSESALKVALRSSCFDSLVHFQIV